MHTQTGSRCLCAPVFAAFTCAVHLNEPGNVNTHSHTRAHILSGGTKLDVYLHNSSQQITRSSCTKGKKTEHMLVDSCIGYKETPPYHKCS